MKLLVFVFVFVLTFVLAMPVMAVVGCGRMNVAPPGDPRAVYQDCIFSKAEEVKIRCDGSIWTQTSGGMCCCPVPEDMRSLAYRIDILRQDLAEAEGYKEQEAIQNTIRETKKNLDDKTADAWRDRWTGAEAIPTAPPPPGLMLPEVVHPLPRVRWTPSGFSVLAGKKWMPLGFSHRGVLTESEKCQETCFSRYRIAGPRCYRMWSAAIQACLNMWKQRTDACVNDCRSRYGPE